jgi:uracil-DNA glycosylase
MDPRRDDERRGIAEILAWHLAAGADAVLDDAPHNRFEEALNEAGMARDVIKRASGTPLTRSDTPSRASIAPIPAIAAGPVKDWVREAELLAKASHSLDMLRENIAAFEGCPLSRTSKSCITASGPAQSGILVIGDAPEADDDRSGGAFSGRAGMLFDAMMKAIGLSRDSLALTTAIPWRPPGNRAPTLPELDVCAPFLRRQVELLQPRLILALGNLPAHLLAGRHESVLKLRGQWLEITQPDRTIKLMTSLPPSYLLRQPMQKRFAWRDLKLFRAALAGKDA